MGRQPKVARWEWLVLGLLVACATVSAWTLSVCAVDVLTRLLVEE